MAQWIALTTSGANKTVIVNLDQVAMMQDLGGNTTLHFNAAQGGSHFAWTVSESLDEITALRSKAV